MPKPLSDDLRCRILDAYEQKEGSQSKLAARFGVSFDYVHKILRHWRRSGKKERVPQSRYGRPSRVTEAVRDQLRVRLADQPDKTLAELSADLQTIGVPLGRSRISQILQQMSLGRKKNASRRRARLGSESQTARRVS
jgi:transposase